MTLIITSIRPREIVITADSRASINDDSRFLVVDDAFQKIFPVAEHSIAISHHGENELAGRLVGTFLDDFISTLNTGNLTILEIADRLRDSAHPAVRTCLEKIGKSDKHGCGFIVAGFGADDNGPSSVEVFWKIGDDALVTEERRWDPICVIPSGAGVPQIDAVDWHKIADIPLDDVREYHAHLIHQAISAPVEHNTVGGSVHEVVIRREGWQWTLPPPRTAPATQPQTRQS